MMIIESGTSQIAADRLSSLWQVVAVKWLYFLETLYLANGSTYLDDFQIA